MRYFIIIISLIVSGSCKKSFLEVDDMSVLNKQTYVKDLRTMEQFVNGLHITFNRDYLKDISGIYSEVIADNIKPSMSRNPPSLLAHYSWAQVADNSQESTVGRQSLAMNGDWKSSYLTIRSCNFVIEDADKYRSEDAVKADEFKGQAYALRALMYLKLANIFAQTYTFTSDASHIGIPYITTSNIATPFTRETVASNYEQMVKDLNMAIDLLPEQVTDLRFMNRLAAKAILARVYLYMGNYDNAIDLAEEITSKVPLLTIANGYPNGLFTFFDPSKNEVLFQSTPVYSTAPRVSTGFVSNSLRNLIFFATEDIAAILNEDINDARAQWIQPATGGWQIIKFPSGIAGIHPSPAHDYYPSVIRSSEMFLTVAECAAKTDDEEKAREYLNAVRTRANPLISLVTATGDPLLDSIYKERRKELAFEGMRMHDIQRWHQSVQRIDAALPGAVILPYPSNKAIAPIPLNDVIIASIEQNLDY